MMNRTQLLANSLFAIFCAALVNAKSFAEPINLSQVKADLKTYYNSGSYTKELGQIIAEADQYIQKRAQANQKSLTPQKLALILDIDETSLSNYKHMLARDFSENPKFHHKDRLAANSTVIEPMLSLYQHALQHHIHVFFVSGRPVSEYQATIKNLNQAGYHDWAGLYLRPEPYSYASNIPFKTEMRKKITTEGYTIIASIGDQTSDFIGGYTEKGFKLPNPYYHVP